MRKNKPDNPMELVGWVVFFMLAWALCFYSVHIETEKKEAGPPMGVDGPARHERIKKGIVNTIIDPFRKRNGGE